VDIDSFARKIPKEKSFSTRRIKKCEIDQTYFSKYLQRGMGYLE